jgi:hypothetical protein
MATIKERLEVIFGVSGADKFKKEFEQADKTVGKASKGMTSAMKGIGAAAVAYLSVQTVKAAGLAALGMVKLADEFRVVQLSSERLAKSIGQNSQEILTATRKGVGGAVSDLNILKQVNTAILLGIPVTAKEMGNMAQVATRLGRAVGRDAASALGDLVTGIGRMSPLILDNLGITIKAEEAFRGLGEGASDADKRLAFFTAVMEKAKTKSKELGDQAPTTTEHMGKLDAAFEKFSILLGKKFKPAVDAGTSALTALVEAANKALGNPAVAKLLDLPAGTGITQRNPTGQMTYVPGKGFVGAGNATSGMKWVDPLIGPRRPGSGILPPRLMGAQTVYRPGDGFGSETPDDIFNRLTNTGDFYDGFVEGLSKSLKTKGPEWKKEFKKVAEAGGDEFAKIPGNLEAGMAQALGNISVQFSSLGLQSAGGVFRGLGGISGGLSGLHQANNMKIQGEGFLATIQPGLAKFTAAMNIFLGAVQLFGVAASLTRENFEKKSDEEILGLVNDPIAYNQLGQRLEGQEAIDASRSTLQGGQVDREVQDVRDKARSEANARGLLSGSSGSNAYSVSTSITETQANSIVAVLETQRAQDAERNNILGQSLAVQNDMKFLMSINSGSLTTFAG